jgi:hypothetical protein
MPRPLASWEAVPTRSGGGTSACIARPLVELLAPSRGRHQIVRVPLPSQSIRQVQCRLSRLRTQKTGAQRAHFNASAACETRRAWQHCALRSPQPAPLQSQFGRQGS